MEPRLFLKDLKPAEAMAVSTFRLPDSLVAFLAEVASTRKTTTSAVLREIVAEAKSQWDQMTPAQKRGAHE